MQGPEAGRRIGETNGSEETQDWLVGGGEMGEMIRAMDWSGTPLGSLETWPDSLKTTVNLCLSSNFPINIIWGPSYNQIYNDGYRVIVGDRHPEGMGMAYDKCWASAWPAVGRPFENAWKGETSFLENQRMYLTRNGYLEETFFTFSLSPIRDQSGAIAGLFHPVTETTVAMLSERRTRTLRELAENTSEARSLEVAFASTAATLANHLLDVPFALFYSLEADGQTARLVSHAGIASELAASPRVLSSKNVSGWPLAEILANPANLEIKGLRERFGEFACGPYPEGCDRAVARPLYVPGLPKALGVLIVGLSPRLPLNKTYLEYLEQLTSGAATALGTALAYEQERKRAKALAEIDHAKTQFFANVSHEFRTPLALMLGPVEAVLSTGPQELSDENREQIRIVRRNSLRLLKLVNSLLDFSRIEAGRAQAIFESTDLSTLTAELAGNFRSAIESAGMELIVDVASVGVDVYVDREMWEKIVLNLISNAYKFTMKGRIEVHLRAQDGTIRLDVVDTGAGIPHDQVAHVFERFHRVEGAERRTHEGSGIGLTLVDEFARLHGGRAYVQSELGAGSRFTVEIARGTRHLDADRIRSPREDKQRESGRQAYTEEALRWKLPTSSEGNTRNGTGSNGSVEDASRSRRFRVLLAEDNADMQDYILRVIGDEYDVRRVGDGQEALEAIASERPDLLLSDVMMPRMDGITLVQKIRSNPETQALPIILLSARAGEEAKAEGIELGADDYLVKPFSPRELKARVRTHLELQALRAEITGHLEFSRVAGALRESEKLAVVGRLASSIAHEVNNPLEAVTNLIYLASGAEDQAELKEYLETAQQELQRVSKITMQTLRFHRQSTKPEVAELTEIAETVITLFAARFVNGRIAMERQFRSSGRITCRAADLRQVLVNLIQNALDATPSGGRVVLRVKDQTDWRTGENAVRLTVADTGSGMSDDVRARIFEPFFTTKESTGTGLGLWVSAEILKNHGATVRVRSKNTGAVKGTAFSIVFPVHPSP